MNSEIPTWYNVNEVLITTGKALEAIQAKYQSDAPESFHLAPYVTPLNPSTDSSDKALEPRYAYNIPSPSSFIQQPPVYIDYDALIKEIETNIEHYSTKALPPDWAQNYHYTINDFQDETQADKLAQYVLVLDALNFCFWPLPGYEYEHLAGSLKRTLELNPAAFSADSLISLTEEQLSEYLQPPSQFPLIDQPNIPAAIPNANGKYSIPLLSARTRLLREVGAVLKQYFHGKASNVIKMANQSALTLVRIITSYFPGFRDHSQFGGDQVFFYKRAQIFVGDIWGAFNGKYLGTFYDMDKLTCFADYRIPQLFRGMGILKFSPSVSERIENFGEISANSEEEIAIRAATVQCVELLRIELKKRGIVTHPFQLDWLLWEAGEKLMKVGRIVPHHRTITTYY